MATVEASAPPLIYEEAYLDSVQLAPASRIYRLYPSADAVQCIYHENIEDFLRTVVEVANHRDLGWREWFGKLDTKGETAISPLSCLNHNIIFLQERTRVDEKKKKEDEEEMSTGTRLVYILGGGASVIAVCRSLVDDFYMLSILTRCYERMLLAQAVIAADTPEEEARSACNPHYRQLKTLHSNVLVVMPKVKQYHRYKGVSKVGTAIAGSALVAAGLLQAPFLAGAAVVVGIPSLTIYFGVKKWYGLSDADTQLQDIAQNSQRLLQDVA